jgi:Ca-activated chloride channel family protein
MTPRPLVLLVILMMATAIIAAAQKDTFKVAAEEVRMDVLVTENGKPVAGLGAADFEVFDNGVLQEIHYTTLQKQTPISATLVFDMSSSLAGQVLDHLKEAASGFLGDLRNEDCAALIMFNNAVVLGSPPTHDFSRVKVALDLAQPFGKTALIDGIYAGLVLAESRPDQPLLIIFSDGLDTFSWLTSEAVLDTAKSNDAVIYAVSTGRLPNKTFLSDLTRLSGGSLLEIESNSRLLTVFLGILEEFRQRYLVSYTPQGVSESGWHRVDVHVKNRSVKVRARPGYLRSSSDEQNEKSGG